MGGDLTLLTDGYTSALQKSHYLTEMRVLLNIKTAIRTASGDIAIDCTDVDCPRTEMFLNLPPRFHFSGTGFSGFALRDFASPLSTAASG
jgi:hypothetical protein